MSDEVKNQKITIRVSPTEKKEIEAKAEQAKMSVSRYLIAAAENKKIRVTEKIPNLYMEITRIGVNINQIAHVANSQKYVNTQQICEVKKLLREVNASMEQVLKAFEDDDDKDIQVIDKKIQAIEKSMLVMERRMSTLERNFDEAFCRLDLRLERLIELSKKNNA